MESTHTLQPLTHFVSLVHLGTLAQQQLQAGRMAIASRTVQWCGAILRANKWAAQTWAAAGKAAGPQGPGHGVSKQVEAC